MRDHLDKLDLKNNPVVQVSCNSCKCEQCNFTATKGATSKDHFTNKHGASSKFDCKFCSLTAPSPQKSQDTHRSEPWENYMHANSQLSTQSMFTSTLTPFSSIGRTLPFTVTCVVFLSFNLMIWMATYKDAM